MLNPTAFAIKPKTFLKDFVKLLSFSFSALALDNIIFEFLALNSKLYCLIFTETTFNFKKTIILPTELWHQLGTSGNRTHDTSVLYKNFQD